MSREVVTQIESEILKEDSQPPCGVCSTKPRSGCTGPPISTGESPISALDVLRFICASTSPRRYSDSRLTSSPIAPSSLCWHRNATPRLKLGSRIDGIAIRKLLVSVVIANMALLYALLRYGVRVRGVQRFCGKNSIYT